MKITGTDAYLRVALHTLKTKIVPELSSSDGQGAAAVLGQVLEELLKRETSSTPLLAKQVALGRELAGRLEGFAAGADVAFTRSECESEAYAGHFSGLAKQHEGLTSRIASVAGALSARRGALSEIRQTELSALLLEVAQWDQDFPLAQRDMTLPADAPLVEPKGRPLDRDLLDAFLRSVHADGNAISVLDLQPISGGFGKQTFRTRIRNAKGEEQNFIVRKSDPNPMALKGAFLVDREYHLLRDVYRAGGLPLAEPLWLAKDFPGVDADFYVMSALPGAVPSSFLGASSAAIPETIILQMAEHMAHLHQMELSRFSNYIARFEHPAVITDTIESCYRRSIAEWKDYYEQQEHLPSPFVIYLLDWLTRNVPKDSRRPVLVHGDFNIHNVLAQEERITGILDWECAMIGAPEQDLAYVRPIMKHHISWDKFVGHYRAAGGPEVNAAAMDFYMAFSAMRLCILFNKGVRNMQDGVHRDIRYSVIDLGLTPEFMKQAFACTRN